MLHERVRLHERRAARRAELRRRRLIAAGSLLAVVALVAGIVTIGTGSADKQQSATAASAKTPQTGSPNAASEATVETAGSQQAQPAWTKPLATEAQQAAAVARVVKSGKPVYCAGGRHGRYVALTFDDGPGVYTHFAMKKLKKWQVRATFFLIGKLLNEPQWRTWAKRETYLAATGDHSWTHPYLPGLGINEVQTQLADTKQKAEAVTGVKVRVFRPPYGARTDAIDAVASKLGMAQIIWDVDSRDSLGANWAGIAANVKAGLKPGAIILLHENRGQTIRALPYILPELKRKHLTAVTVPELLALDPPTDAQLAAGPNGCASLRGSGAKVGSGA